MAYTNPNFKTKKALKEAFAAGKDIDVFSPGPFDLKTDGWVSLEGPHYPKPHSWYAQGFLESGKLTKLK